MKRILSFVLVLCMLLTLVPMAALADFSDTGSLIPAFRESIDWAVAQGITTGYGDNTFRPNNSCTRAQAVTFLWRAAGQPAPQSAKNPFTDVSSSGSLAPYYDAILWAVEQGITNGYEDKTFRPNATVTRGQFVTFLWRMEGKPAPVTGVGGFADAASIAGPYVDAVAWAVEQGITTGYEDDTFRPNGVCTRAHVVTFLYRNVENSEAEAEAYMAALHTISTAVKSIESGYTDEDGFITEEKADVVDDMIYQYGCSLVEDGTIKDVKMNGFHSVSFFMDDGSIILYTPSYKGLYSSADPDFTMLGINLLGTDDNTHFLFKNPTEAMAAAVENTCERYTQTAIVNLNGSNVNLKYFTEQIIGRLGTENRTVVWRGHGAVPFPTKEIDDQIGFIVPVNITADFINEWKSETEDESIVISTDEKTVALTYKYFEKHLPKVNSGAFITCACYGLYNESIADVFKDKGYDAYVGPSLAVSQPYANSFLKELANQMVKKTEAGDYVLIQDALSETKANVGINESVYISMHPEYVGFIGAIVDYLINGCAEFRLVEADIANEYRFRIEPRLRTVTGTVLGTIPDKAPEPLEGVSVEIVNKEFGKSYTATTDADGKFTVDDVYAGTLGIKFSGDGLITKTVGEKTHQYLYPAAVDIGEIYLDQYFSLSARVVDEETGEAIAGATVNAFRSGSDEPVAAAVTNANGAFSFEELPAGNYTVTVSCEGYEDLSFTVTGEAGDNIVCPTLKMKKDDPIGKQIELILANKKLWCSADKSPGAIYRYTVTDMDQDGLLEIFEHSMMGTGIMSFYNLYEVSPDMRSLVKLGTNSRGMPDIGENHDCYYDSVTDTYYYVICDTLRNGWGSTSYGDYLVSVADAEMKTELVRMRVSEYDSSGTYTDSYYNASNVSVSKGSFDKLIDSRCAGMTKLSASFRWINYNEDSTTLSWFSGTDSLVGSEGAKLAFLDSYENFKLTPAVS